MFKKIITFTLIVSVLFTTGCLRTKTTTTSSAKTELVYYKLFDDDDLIKPIIQEFQSTYKNIRIKYKKFTDVQEYENLLINEMAEGEGPDIFEIHNTWLAKHQKKISPMPSDDKFPTPEDFRNTFVTIAADDLIKKDANGLERIYGIPLNVDTLAIYYNKKQFDAKIAAQGKPSPTWDGIKEDVYKLTKQDNSNEKFETAGIAMGRADNIQRATDILYLLFIQEGTNFYDEEYKKAIFASNKLSIQNKFQIPSVEALALYTGFADQNNKQYSWNQYIADANSSEKEVGAFVQGKVSMIVGYPYLYDQMLKLIDDYKKQKIPTIDKKSIQIARIPQVFNPEEHCETYGSYFAETVSRNSKNARAAWTFLKFMAQKKNQEHFFTENHKITSRRDLIKIQSADPLYGVFAKQVGCAKSIPMADDQKYKELFDGAITAVLNNENPETALQNAETEINKIIPPEGLFPVPAVTKKKNIKKPGK